VLFGEVRRYWRRTNKADKKKAYVIYQGWLTGRHVVSSTSKGDDGKLQAFSFTMGAHQVIPRLNKASRHGKSVALGW